MISGTEIFFKEMTTSDHHIKLAVYTINDINENRLEIQKMKDTYKKKCFLILEFVKWINDLVVETAEDMYYT